VFDRVVTVQLKQNLESIAMTTATQSTQLNPDLISKRAYEIWEAMGRPEGVANQTWAEAERQLLADAEKQNAKQETRTEATTTHAPLTTAESTPPSGRLHENERAEADDELTKPSSVRATAAATTTASTPKKDSQNHHRRGSRR
jgi:hypothetical protein